MKTRLSFKPKIILMMLLGSASLGGLSMSLFGFLNGIVNNDLYDFDLQYSVDWSIRYWTYYNFAVFFLGAAVAAVIVALLSIAMYMPKRRSVFRSLGLGMMIFGGSSTALSAFWFVRLDQVVHSELYGYGLTFSNEWAMRYWTYSYSIVGLQAAMIGMTFFAALLFFLGTRVEPRVNLPRLVLSIMLVTGAASLVFSVAENSVILAFIGLGLAFWGGILIYIRSQDYTQKTLLDSMVISSIKPLDEIMKELNYKGISVYLPPSYFKDPDTNRVCILKQDNSRLPSTIDVQSQESEFLVDDPQAILVTPVGSELLKLFEKTLDTNFTKVDAQYLQQNLQRLLVEKLEVAQEARMEIENERIRVFLEKPIFSEMYTKMQKQPSAMRCLGTPISSALACGLAKVSGKLVTITKDELVNEGETIAIEFLLMSEPEKVL